MRQAERSALAKPGSSRHRLYIAGTISVWVIRSRASSATKAAALNAGTTTTVPPTRHIVAITAIRPVTWLAGTASAERSSGPSRMQAS